MSDSIDRVFAHALQTVRKIPRATAQANVPGSPSVHAGSTTTATSTHHTGPRRPPAEDRLRLYGFYKQSMEGDVLGVMERPSEKVEADKWDAWNAVRGMSRTEAKRRYIECLIETMKKYASDTPDARELVAELEFVWEQVKSNSRHHSANPSISSTHGQSLLQSPIQRPQPQMPPIHQIQQLHQIHQIQQLQQIQQYAQPPPPPAPPLQQQQMLLQFPPVSQSPPPSPTNLPLSQYRQEPSRPPEHMENNGDYRGYQSSGGYENVINPGQPYYEQHEQAGPQQYPPLRRMKVGSRGTRSLHSGEDDEQSGYEEAREHTEEDEEEEEEEDEDDFEEPSIAQLHHHDRDNDEEYDDYPSRLILGRDTSPDVGTMRWQLRVERAMSKMSAEIAALREQLEIRNTHVLNHSSSWFWTGNHSDSSRRQSQSMSVTGQRKEIASVGKRFGKVVWQAVWTVLRHLMVDAVVVGIVVWWMGRRGDSRSAELWRWITRILGRRRRRGDKHPTVDASL